MEDFDCLLAVLGVLLLMAILFALAFTGAIHPLR